MRPKSRLLLGLLFLMVPAQAAAQCVDYSKHLKWLGGEILPFPADAVAIQGNYAYIASSHGRLLVVDITNPAELSVVRHLWVGGDLNNVAVHGERTFVTWLGGLLMVEPALPDSVIWEASGSVPIPYANGVAISPAGDYAFVSAGPNGLQVVDVPSNGNVLQVVGGVDTPGVVFDVVLAGNHAYVADYTAGLQVIDISNPLSPAIVGNADPPGYAKSVAILGSLACLADEFLGVHVIDISNPMSPSVLGWVDSPGFPKSVAMVGTHALLADQHAGVHSIDLSNPASPTLVGTVSMPDYPLDIRVAGNVAYIAHYANGLQMLDITYLTSPSIVSSQTPPKNTKDVAIAGNRAYLADDYFLRMFDVSNPAAPSLLGATLLPGIARGVAVAGDHAYVIDEDFRVINVTDPANAMIVASVDTLWQPRDVELGGNYAYVVDNFGLRVLDVSTPTAPAVVGSGLQLSYSQHVAVQGQVAIVSRWDYGVSVIDISNAALPAVIATFDTLAGNSYAATIDGNYAYIAQGGFSGEDAVYVIDISNAGSPQVVASVDLYGGTESIAKWGSYVYAGPGVRVIDVVDPTQPKFIGGRTTSGYASYAIAPTDHYLYLAEDTGGLVVVPSQCEPTLNPVLFQHVAAVADSRGVVVRWELFADEEISGFDVFRRSLADGATGRLNGRLLDSGSRTFRDDTVQPGRSYDYFVVAVLPRGERIQSQSAAVATRALELVLHQNHPNPFNPTTVISFVIPEKGRAQLAVYDVRGVRVRVLMDGVLPAGYREAIWDGRDDRGVAVASGVYFCKLIAAKQSVTRKMMLLQ